MKRPLMNITITLLLIAALLLPLAAQAASPVLQEGGTEHPFGLTDVQWYILGAALLIVPFVLFIFLGRKKE